MFGLFPDPVVLANVLLVLALAYFIGKWALAENQEIKERREKAGQLANKLSSFGLTRTSKVLIAYSTGNYIRFVQLIGDVFEDFLNGEAAVLRELTGAVERMAASTDGRKLLSAALSKVADPATPAPAPVAAPAPAAA